MSRAGSVQTTAVVELLPAPGKSSRLARLRSLLWKELREQRPILLSGLALLGLVPIMIGFAATSVEHTRSLQAAAELTPRAAPFLLWPLMALAAGAVAIAGDSASPARIGFLLSRPAARPTLWGCKVAAAATTVVVMIVATDLLGRGLAALDGGAAFSLLRWSEALPRSSADAQLVFLALPAVVTLYFACAVLLGGCFPRPLTVVFAGAVSATLLYAGVIAVWWTLDVYPRLTLGRMVWGPLLVAGSLLAASAWSFGGGEMLRGRQIVRRTVLAGPYALAAVVTALGLAAVIEARPPGVDAFFMHLRGSADGRLMATAYRPDGASRTVWVSDPDARRFVTSTDRLTEHAVASSDGAWIAYTSMHGTLGRKSRHARVHVMRPDGSDDRIVLGGLRTPKLRLGINGNATRSLYARFHVLAFSQGARWLAVQQEETLYTIDLSSGVTTRRRLDPGCLLLGWRAAPLRMVAHCRYGPPRLMELPLQSAGGGRSEVSLPGYRRPGPSSDSPADLGTLAFVDRRRLQGTGSRAWATRLLATSPEGSLRVVFEGTATERSLETATGGATIAWVTAAAGGGTATLWAAGEGRAPRAITQLAGHVRQLWVAPDGRWSVALVSHRAPSGESYELSAISLTDARRIMLSAEPTWLSEWDLVWLGADHVAHLSGTRRSGVGFGELFVRYRAVGVLVHDLATGESWHVEPLR